MSAYLEKGSGGADLRAASRVSQYRSMAALERTMGKEMRSQRRRAMHFDRRNNSIELKMPFEKHELTAAFGEKMVKRALQRVGMSHAFKLTKSARIEKAGKAKEPDSSFAWRPEHRGRLLSSKLAPPNLPETYYWQIVDGGSKEINLSNHGIPRQA
ncbi:polar growth protein [Ascosphaera pollenicola]|nr:polar growth protein [Ascosphaera pollenicola]